MTRAVDHEDDFREVRVSPGGIDVSVGAAFGVRAADVPRLHPRVVDGPAFEALHRARALAEARRWSHDVLADRHASFFESLVREG